MTKLENYLKEVKARNQDCVCDARYSGVDESLYSSRGCPSCECHHLADVEVLLGMVKELEKQRDYSIKDYFYSKGFGIDVVRDSIGFENVKLEALVPEEER